MNTKTEESSTIYPDMVCLSDIADGQTVKCGDSAIAGISASMVRPSPNTQIFEYRFTSGQPIRFSTGFRIPVDVVNACATLNDLLLTGLFSENLPEGAILPECLSMADDHKNEHSHKTTSTITPGRMQVVNFRWFDQDVLRFYLYFG
ncbi:MAG: hypothetical protein ACYC5K_11355 [Saccharofermentanales bacterium]